MVLATEMVSKLAWDRPRKFFSVKVADDFSEGGWFCFFSLVSVSWE